MTRGTQKAELQRLGCYVDALCFSKEMSEIQVKQKLRQVFEKELVDSEGKAVPRGGGTPLYTLYKYVPPDRVGFLRCSVLK